MILTLLFVATLTVQPPATPDAEDIGRVVNVTKWIKDYEADPICRYEQPEIAAVHADLEALRGVEDAEKYHKLTDVLWEDMGILAVLDNQLYRSYLL